MLYEILSPKILRTLRLMRRDFDVSEELRGWCWYREPVRPPSDLVKLSVSDVASRYCKTMRDLYLKHVIEVDVEPSVQMIWGRKLHETFRETVVLVKQLLSRDVTSGVELVERVNDIANAIVNKVLKDVSTKGLDQGLVAKLDSTCRALCKYLVVQIASRVNDVLSRFGRSSLQDSIVYYSVPLVTEYIIDGSLVGLKEVLRVDAIAYNILVEVKTGQIEEFHKLSLAGYALAMESDLEIPVDYGLLIYINFNSCSTSVPKIKVVPVVISDELRREFLDLRDQAMEIVLHERDPGIPDACPETCPYRRTCVGERR